MGAGGHGPSNCFDIVGFSEILMLRRNIFELLLLIKAKVSNFIGKSLNLAPLLYRCHDVPEALPFWQPNCVLVIANHWILGTLKILPLVSISIYSTVP